MDRWAGRVALVTGSSCGIGASVSKMLIASQMTVYGCGRNLENLQKLKSEMKTPDLFHPLKCDVGVESEVLQMIETIEKQNTGIDVLINNAGLAHFSPRSILEGNTHDWKEMLDVNILGVCLLTRECVKSMRSRNVDGQIINLSSMSGHRIVGGSSNFYAVTKHAVTALTEGIRNELRSLNSNIRVCQISPGVVQTEFFERASKGKMNVDKMPALQSEDIAGSVKYILSAPPHVQIHDILLRNTTQKS